MKKVDINTKREREKEMVSLMIDLYCRKIMAAKMEFVRSAKNSRNMRKCEVISVHLWRRKLSVQIAKYTATSQKCVKKYGKSCAFQVRE